MHRKTDWSENRKDDKGEMSFSGMVKEELSRQIGLARHCKMAELAAILCSCGKMECFSGDSKLKIQTENEAVARKCFTLLQKTFNIETKIFVRENSHLKRVKVYTIEITDPEEIQVIFQALRLRQRRRHCSACCNPSACNSSCAAARWPSSNRGASCSTNTSKNSRGTDKERIHFNF